MSDVGEGSSAPIDTTVTVEAPEQIRFRHRVAGPAARGLAYLVDLFVMAVIITVAAVVLFVAKLASGAVPGRLGDAFTGVGMALGLLGWFVLQWGYFLLFEAFGRGATPGKRALSLRVLKEGGEPIGVMDAVLRNLLRAADFLPFGYAVGLVTMCVDPRFRRLGDLLAGTMVVIDERASRTRPLRITPPDAVEQSAMPVMPRVAPDVDRAIEALLRRAPQLGLARTNELAQMIAPSLAARYGLPNVYALRQLELLYLATHAARRAPPQPPRVPG